MCTVAGDVGARVGSLPLQETFFGGANIGDLDVTDNHYGFQQAVVRNIAAGCAGGDIHRYSFSR